jgi:ribosomal RNA assembly protein
MSTTEGKIEESEIAKPEGKVKKNYRKDKPWDNETIDHWKVEDIKPEEVQPFL